MIGGPSLNGGVLSQRLAIGRLKRPEDEPTEKEAQMPSDRLAA